VRIHIDEVKAHNKSYGNDMAEHLTKAAANGQPHDMVHFNVATRTIGK
jgi:hypothetical protein